MVKPLNRRVVCRYLPYKTTTGGIWVDPGVVAPCGRTNTGYPHIVGVVIDLAPDCKGALKVGDHVLVEGMNIELRPELGDDIGLPLEAAILGILEELPDCVDTDE